MNESDSKDYYELLQISPNADPDTVTRVFRLLAQRYHPDNAVTGNDDKFREILEAYAVLNDPERRAQYDVVHGLQRQARWRFVEAGARAADDVAGERELRMQMLDILYARRRLEPHRPGLSLLDMAELLGRPLEHLEFACWYLVQRQFAVRNDQSQMAITANGVDALEEQRAARRPGEPRRIPEHSGETAGG